MLKKLINHEIKNWIKEWFIIIGEISLCILCGTGILFFCFMVSDALRGL